MDINYCGKLCNIGKAKSEELLKINNSAYDAAIDFWAFTDKCFETCPFKDKHTKDNQ